MQCDDGDVRLLTGEIRGQLVVCVSKRWETIASRRWSDVEATVVCRQLGYDSGETYSRIKIPRVQKCMCITQGLSCWWYFLKSVGQYILNSGS